MLYPHKEVQFVHHRDLEVTHQIGDHPEAVIDVAGSSVSGVERQVSAEEGQVHRRTGRQVQGYRGRFPGSQRGNGIGRYQAEGAERHP